MENCEKTIKWSLLIQQFSVSRLYVLNWVIIRQERNGSPFHFFHPDCLTALSLWWLWTELPTGICSRLMCWKEMRLRELLWASCRYLGSHPEGGSHRGVPPQTGICQLGWNTCNGHNTHFSHFQPHSEGSVRTGCINNFLQVLFIPREDQRGR